MVEAMHNRSVGKSGEHRSEACNSADFHYLQMISQHLIRIATAKLMLSEHKSRGESSCFQEAWLICPEHEGAVDPVARKLRVDARR